MSTAGVRKEDAATPPIRNRILLQVDDSALRRDLRETLARAGFEVDTVCAFKDLAAWLFAHPDATLVIALPAIDFFRRAVLREVRRLAPTARIIALAAGVAVDLQRDAVEANVAAVVAIGATPTEIADLIKNACN
jgi:DNA-binding NtrC family response regulator